MSTTFPSAADLRFWQAKRTPSWGAQFVKHSRPNIDECVNAHGQLGYTNGELAACNTLAVLRLARGRGRLLQSLREMGSNPATIVHPERRAAFAKKWLHCLRKSPQEVRP